MGKLRGTGGLLCVLVLACGESSTTPMPPDAGLPPLTSERPLVYFGPGPADLDREYEGSMDYMALFEEEAEWSQATSRIHAFQLFGGWVAHRATDEELRQIVEYLDRHGIPIAFEARGLWDTAACRGVGVGMDEPRMIAQRIEDAGGTARLLTLDHSFDTARDVCGWSTEQIAEMVASYVVVMREEFPDILVADTLTLGSSITVDDVVDWLDTFERVSGEPFWGLHHDTNYLRQSWGEEVKELEDAVRARGVEFGMIYFGAEEASTDTEWVDGAWDRLVHFETEFGGRPEHVLFQSWHDHPDYSLPESASDTFTHLVNRYFRDRTSISLVPGAPAEDESITLRGVLSGPTGPLANRAVSVSTRRLDGDGEIGQYSFDGFVPAGSTMADAGIRVNIECDCAGEAEIYIYEARYTEVGDEENRVPNGDFSAGAWGCWGDGTTTLEPSDQGAGQMFHVQVSAGQTLGCNTEFYPTTPGAEYSLTFTARVSPISRGSGYFSSSREVGGRLRMALEPAARLGEGVTGPDGAYAISIPQLAAGEHLVEARYGGDTATWPAYASVMLP